MTNACDDPRALVRRLIDAGARRDRSAIEALYAPDAVAISPVFGELRGRDRIAASWSTLLMTLADAEVVVSDVLVDGARVAVLSELSTTDRAGWFGRAATGSRISYRLVLLLTLEDGRIVRDERIYDSAGVVERLEKARLDKELRTAADVQRMLLPRRTHAAPFCASAGASLPCRAIGGDFFEFLDLADGAVGIAMGDVAGKGPAAALLASLVQGMLAIAAPTDPAPAVTLARINRELVARAIPSRYVTMFYGVLDSGGRFRYANGGHNPPLLVRRAGDVNRLTTGGPIVGAFEGATFDHETLELGAGDTIVVFTDGVTEARNAQGEEFGDERLVMAAASAAPAEIVLDDVLASVRAFCGDVEQSDDITITVTRIGGG